MYLLHSPSQILEYPSLKPSSFPLSAPYPILRKILEVDDYKNEPVTILIIGISLTPGIPGGYTLCLLSQNDDHIELNPTISLNPSIYEPVIPHTILSQTTTLQKPYTEWNTFPTSTTPNSTLPTLPSAYSASAHSSSPSSLYIITGKIRPYTLSKKKLPPIYYNQPTHVYAKLRKSKGREYLEWRVGSIDYYSNFLNSIYVESRIESVYILNKGLIEGSIFDGGFLGHESMRIYKKFMMNVESCEEYWRKILGKGVGGIKLVNFKNHNYGITKTSSGDIKLELRKYRKVQIQTLKGYVKHLTSKIDSLNYKRLTSKIYSTPSKFTSLDIKGKGMRVEVLGEVEVKERGGIERWFFVEVGGEEGWCEEVEEEREGGFDVRMIEETKTITTPTSLHKTQEFNSTTSSISGTLSIIAEGKWRNREAGVGNVTWYYVKNEEEEEGWIWERRVFF